MAKKWIAGAIKHPGALKATAARDGKTVSQLEANPPKDASPTTLRRIRLAEELKRFHKG